MNQIKNGSRISLFAAGFFFIGEAFGKGSWVGYQV